ncbi:MAG: hypothetical protein ACUVUS_06825 [Thermoproteota archaeon]
MKTPIKIGIKSVALYAMKYLLGKACSTARRMLYFRPMLRYADFILLMGCYGSSLLYHGNLFRQTKDVNTRPQLVLKREGCFKAFLKQVLIDV